VIPEKKSTTFISCFFSPTCLQQNYGQNYGQIFSNIYLKKIVSIFFILKRLRPNKKTDYFKRNNENYKIYIRVLNIHRFFSVSSICLAKWIENYFNELQCHSKVVFGEAKRKAI